MEIQTIDIRKYYASCGVFVTNNLFHQKSLPVLSVVQSLEGSYQIGIDTMAQQETGTRGAFIAPSGKMQYITHCIDQATGVMRAHWIFLEVLVNGQYRLDNLYDFPTLLPEKYQNQVYDIISYVMKTDNICEQLSVIYKLIQILMEIGTEKDQINPFVQTILSYTDQHLGENITDDKLSKVLAISKPTLYRRFKANFHMSPANYVNDIRLSKSVVLLETTDLPISSICDAIGIDDSFYFSKLFKRKYGVPPSLYRKTYRNP